MAADQRKKPVTTVRSVANRHDQGRVEKKNSGSFPSARSNIVSLEWDDKNDSVVAKKEQIGLSQRHLVSFGSSDFRCTNALADVLTLPSEVFELDVVKEVLSPEVWQTLLSENEKQYLMQFLPDGLDLQEVLQELLVTDSNFHFGNPFLKWIASLCSGNLHPDIILYREYGIRASKKRYYSDLLKYHNGMINNLLMWKERWSASKNPEEEIVEKMWRSRKKAGNKSSEANEHSPNKVQDDVAGTSGSGSSAAEENAGSSDNQNKVSRHTELQQREVMLVERPKIGERLHKQNTQRCDGSKYMSYIKVSKKQHQRVKSSLKLSGNSIQSRSLNRVLGNLHSFQIQPFEVFEEEERKKLHAHWLQLANTDVPAAFANFRRWQLAKSRLPHYWKQEMEDKLVSIKKDEQDKEKERSHITSPPVAENSSSSCEATDAMEIEEANQSDSLLEEHPDDRAYMNELVIPSEAMKKDNTASITEQTMVEKTGLLQPALEHDSQFALSSIPDQHMNITDTGNYISRGVDYCQPNAPEYSENLKRVVGNAVAQEVPISTSSNMWPLGSIGNPYGHSNTNSFVSSQLLSHGHLENQQSGLTDLGFNNNEEVRNSLWHKQSHDGPFLSSFPVSGDIRVQNDLNHHHFLKGPDALSYHQQEQNHTPFNFEQLQASTGFPVGRSQYFGKFREQSNTQLPLIDLMREKNLNSVHVDMANNISRERMFAAEELRYNIPMQQQRDWAANVPRQSFPPLQPGFGIGDLVQNRLVGDAQTLGGWSNIDESLYVGNSTSELPYTAPFDLVQGPPQQFIGSGFGSSPLFVAPSVNNMLLSPPGDLLSGQESSSLLAPHHPLVNNNNPMLVRPTGPIDAQEPMLKPFPRPWNS